jgi:hypothetical protein
MFWTQGEERLLTQVESPEEMSNAYPYELLANSPVES